jgi:hypothetical protein
MPFVIAGLGDLAYALILFCIAAAIGTLTAEIARLVPNPSIAGYHPFSFVGSALSDVHDWAVNTSDSAILRLRNLIVDVAHIDNIIVSRIITAINHSLGGIAHLFNVVVPDAQNAAQSYADQAAATVHNYADGLANSLQNNIDTDTNAINSLSSFVNGAFHTDIEHDISNAATNALNSAENFTQAGLNDLTATLNADLSLVWGAITPLQNAVAVTIPGEFVAQAQQEQSDIRATAQTAQANLVTATQNLQDELTGVNDNLTATIIANATAQQQLAAADLSTAEGVADADSAAAVVTATSEAAAQLQQKSDELQGQITTNSASIATLQQQQTITLPALPDISIPSSITIPVAVGGLATAVAGIITEFDDCAVTTCGGPNNISNLLQTLMGGAELAELGAFLAAAVHDPKGEAAAFASVASGLYGTGHSLIDDLLSL